MNECLNKESLYALWVGNAIHTDVSKIIFSFFQKVEGKILNFRVIQLFLSKAILPGAPFELSDVQKMFN